MKHSLGFADDIATLKHARKEMGLVFKNKTESIFNTNPSLFTRFPKKNGQGMVETWEDLFDLANSSDFVEHPIIKRLVEIQ